jgi:hypothetical protein
VKTTAFAFILLMVTLMVFASFLSNMKTVQAQSDYTIEHVNHEVTVLYNGYVLINDTITINVTGQAPTDFFIGFPYKYGEYVLRSVAYNASDFFAVTLNVPLGDRVGFYTVKIDFPQGAPQVFNVEFVFSNHLLVQDSQDATRFTLGFPAYPSLVKPVAVCNGSIVLPKDAVFVYGDPAGQTYGKENLPEFADSSGLAAFTSSVDNVRVMDIEKFSSEIRITELGEIDCADTYYLTNKATESLNFTDIVLPSSAFSVTSQDQLGRKMAEPTQIDQVTNRYRVTFESAVETNKSFGFSVGYILPGNYTVQRDTNSYVFNISMFQHLNYYVAQASVSFIMPEGAKLVSPEDSLVGNARALSLSRNIYQETATITKSNVISLDSFTAEIQYNYNPLWLSFRPAMWVWALSIVGCAVAVAWRRPKAAVARVPAPAAVVKIGAEYLKSFVDSYGEKMKIALELDSLEVRVSKGRIPRRRYKVLRKTLETRLGTLDRDLVESKDRLRGAGGKYSDLMRQLEISEAEINEAETNVKSIEARHAGGELSLEAYRKLQSDYQRRKDGAESTIKGILLRLREEIR